MSQSSMPQSRRSVGPATLPNCPGFICANLWVEMGERFLAAELSECRTRIRLLPTGASDTLRSLLLMHREHVAMSEPVFRTSAEVSGVWFLSESSLLRLDDLLTTQWELLKEQRRQNIINDAKKGRAELAARMKKEDPRFETEKDLVRKRAELRNAQDDRSIILKDGFKDIIQCTTFSDASRAHCDKSPTGFTATIQAGHNVVTMELTEAFMGGERVKITISPVCEATSAALAELESWAEEHRAPAFLCWFRRSYVGVLAGMFFMLWVTTMIFDDKTTTYPQTQALRAEAKQLVEAGISDANRDAALAVILKSMVGSEPVVKRTFSPLWSLGAYLTLIPLMIVAANPPKTVLGIGHGKRVLKRRSLWFGLWSWSAFKWIGGLLVMGLFIQPIVDKVRDFLWNHDSVRTESPETQK